ncbi:hypothetical protein MKX08_002857 [Trichoderma sp. CBMAI-0020]|nr:hypothetical protein MKX08_002857 [Trichoderma sp. CBMAI-0020]
MMKFSIKTLTMISGIFAASAAAMPSGPESVAADASAFDAAVTRWKIANNDTESDLDKRGSQYSVFVCQNTNWNEPCELIKMRSGQWNQIQYPPYYPMGSFGPGDDHLVWLFEKAR